MKGRYEYKENDQSRTQILWREQMENVRNVNKYRHIADNNILPNHHMWDMWGSILNEIGISFYKTSL